MVNKASLTLHKNDINSMYIKEFLLYLKSDKGCRPKTIDVYSQDLEVFKNYYVTRDLLTLKEADIRMFKYTLVDRNLAPRTVNRMLSVVRSFYNYFVNSEEWDDITKNPAKNVTIMKVPKSEPIVLNETQAETLLDGILLTCFLQEFFPESCKLIFHSIATPFSTMLQVLYPCH